MHALPLATRVIAVEPDQAEAVAEARRAVVDSIGRGIPVQYGGEEDGIIFGYQAGGAEWMAYHPMRDGGKKPFVETDWPWAIHVYGLPKERVPSGAELALRALDQAVQMANTPEAGGYHVGFAAWQRYIARLTYLLGADAQTRAGDMLGNAWVYECLAGFRACAAAYLRSSAGDFSEDSAAHMMKAADLYDRMSSEILRDADHCVTDIAPYPWSLGEGEEWGDDALRSEIERLEVAFPVEREAIAELKAAVHIIEGSP